MRIGIDIKCLRYNNSGIGRYLVQLLDALQKIDSQNDYFLFSPQPIDYPLSNPRFHACPHPGNRFFKKLPGILWQQRVLPRLLKENKIDIFWGPEQTLPLYTTGCKKILTIHDFVYRRYPGTMRHSVRWINSHIGEKSIQQADIIAVNSDFTKQELLHFFPKYPEDKIKVVTCGINKATAPAPRERKRQFLFVGSLEPRKNLKNLIIALEKLAGKGIRVPLFLIGPQGWNNSSENNLIRNSIIAGDIHPLGFVSDEKLQELYSSSAAVVFPSFYEGFGLPVLEALRCRTAVLTTKGSVMESIAKECGIYFDARNPDSIADTIETFLNRGEPYDIPQDKEEIRLEILSRFQWENSARTLLQAFQQLFPSSEVQK